MTQNIPYIGVISSALTEFLKIQDVRTVTFVRSDPFCLLIRAQEVGAYRRDWKAVMTTARQIKAVVDDVLKQCNSTSSGDAALPEALIEPFEQLEKYASAFLVVFPR